MYNKEAATRSIYLHWPFCLYRCYFCPFVALAGHDQFMGQYQQALCAEITRFGKRAQAKRPLDTIFLGGGTPSICPDHLLLDMFDTLEDIFVVEKNAEVTIEVNPGTVRKEQLAIWKDIGINRLSIGVQSLNEAALKNLNRHHTASDVRQVLDQAGGLFESTSVDLILGLPGVSADEWKQLLHEVVSWPIEHLSIYFLMVHEYTPLYFHLQNKTMALPDDDMVVDLYTWSIEFLAEHGFAQYEVSNFARPGFESRHNKAYWDRKPYKGFGLGACSFDGKHRFKNETNLMNYIEAMEKDKDCTQFTEELTREQAFMEKIMLGMRQAKGVLLEDIMNDLSDEETERLEKKIAALKENSFVTECNGSMSLTPKGLIVENEIITQLSL